MFGQLGLLAASAADRTRDGAFESDTDVVSTDDSGSRGGNTGVGSVLIQTRDDSAVPLAPPSPDPKIDLDQCRNGSASSPNDCEDLPGGGQGWVNGNAGATQAHFVEGMSIPYRAVLEDMPTGLDVTLVLGYDIKHSGRHALDYLTHFDRLEPHSPFGHSAEDVVPTDGVTGISGTTDTFTIPAPSSTGSPVAGQPTSSYNNLPAAERVMTLFGGDITDIAYVTQGSLSDAQAETRIAVTFSVDSATAVLSWGGHIASRIDWGFDADGDALSAAQIEGSPYHMRLIDWFCTGGESATGCPDGDMPNLGNTDRSLAAAAVIPAPTVAISKTAVNNQGQTVTTVAPGDTFFYEILVTNSGNGQATNVVVTDDLDDSLLSVSATYDLDPPDAGTDGNCTVGAGNTITCPAVTLAASNNAAGGNDELLVRVTATAPRDSCPTVTNQAHVAWTQDSSGNGLDSSQVTVTVQGCAPTLQISKTGASTVAIGQNITWTITVSNTQGNADATNVVVTDTLPAGFTFVSASAGCVNNTPSAGQVQCTIGTIAAGQSAQVTITAMAPSTCGPFTNTVSGTFGTGQTIPGSPATASGNVTGCAPSLTINKAGPATVQEGSSITYTVTVTNSGNASAFNVQISDAVPSPLTNPVGTPSQGSCQTTGNTVNCSLGTISGSGSATISITARVPAGQCVQIQNQATGTHEVNEQQVAIQSSGVVTTQITGCVAPGAPALSVTKTADAAVVQVGSPIGFLITVQNTGSADANNVTLTDTIPSVPGVTWSINGGTGAAQCTLTGNSLSCSFGTLSAGASRTVHIISTATSTASCGTFTNVAVASSSNAGSATGQATVEVDCPPGIDIVKNGPATAYVGDTITYTLDVSLAAGSTESLTNIQVTDTRCDAAPVLVSKTGGDQDATLETGETWHYSCTHVVTATDPDPLPNTSTATGVDQAGNTVSDSDDHVVDILHPGIRIVKTANPESGSPGDVITYRYRITNTGDTTLFDITVDDDVVGHICDIAELQPGESAVCTAQFTIPANANVEITNVAIAIGIDEGGKEVSDEDVETIDVVLGRTVTPPTRTPPGGIAFAGVAGVVPLAGLALLLLTVGSGLLWLGRRRRAGAGG